jgi:methyl-accepting chemotaxis protein WspA
MKNWTVRQRILVGFSAVFIIMLMLSMFAYWRLRDIESKATELNQDSIPSLHLIGLLHAASIETYTSTEQHVLETDPAKMAQITAFIQQKSAERLDILKQLSSTLQTPRDKELLDATNAALALYMPSRAQVLKLSSDPRTKAQAATLLRGEYDSLYTKLQEAIEAQVQLKKEESNEAGLKIQEAVASAQRAILYGLMVGLVLAVISAYLVIQAVNKSLTKLVSVVNTTRNGNQQQLSTANEIAATTAEIGATSKQISVTSKELVRTMKAVAERDGPANRGGLRFHPGSPRSAQRESGKHRHGDYDDHQGCRSNKSFIVERRHRSGESRRLRPRIRGCGDGDSQAR